MVRITPELVVLSVEDYALLRQNRKIALMSEELSAGQAPADRRQQDGCRARRPRFADGRLMDASAAPRLGLFVHYGLVSAGSGPRPPPNPPTFFVLATHPPRPEGEARRAGAPRESKLRRGPGS